MRRERRQHGARGKLDGFSIVLGHEIEETVTDPGAEDVVGVELPITSAAGTTRSTPTRTATSARGSARTSLTGQGPPEPIPGAIGNIKGNAGGTFAVQSLWSNAANDGTGYCAGAGTDSPIPSSSS